MPENFISAGQYKNNRKIIARYTLNVYDDGTVSIEPLNEVSEDKPSAEKQRGIGYNNSPSAKIHQTLVTLQHFRECMDGFSCKELPVKAALNRALDKTSQEFGISKQSITDKLTRQMSKMRVNDWVPILERWLQENDSSEIKELLMNNIAKGNESNDIEAIKSFFSQD